MLNFVLPYDAERGMIPLVKRHHLTDMIFKMLLSKCNKSVFVEGMVLEFSKIQIGRKPKSVL